MSLALELRGVVKRYGERAGARRRRPARRGRRDRSRCSGPTARARARSSRSPPGCWTPDAGTRRRVSRARRGVAPQEIGVYPPLTVRENLRAFAELHGLRARARGRARPSCSSRSRSTELADRPAGRLSGGEQRRLHAAIALVNRPRRRAARRADRGRRPVDARARSCRPCATSPPTGRAVVYTTHYLPEVEASTPTSRCSSAGGSSRAARSRSSSRAHAESALELDARRRARGAAPGHVAGRPGPRA